MLHVVVQLLLYASSHLHGAEPLRWYATRSCRKLQQLCTLLLQCAARAMEGKQRYRS